MASVVEVDGWRLGLIAGSWLWPDGDGYKPEPGSGEVVHDGGDVWVEAPGGRWSATIAWSTGEPRFARMLPPRTAGDLGAFNVTTDTPPETRRDSEAFLRQLPPFLRQLVSAHDIRER
jgi:hypothetical protein